MTFPGLPRLLFTSFIFCTFSAMSCLFNSVTACPAASDRLCMLLLAGGGMSKFASSKRHRVFPMGVSWSLTARATFDAAGSGPLLADGTFLYVGCAWDLNPHDWHLRAFFQPMPHFFSSTISQLGVWMSACVIAFYNMSLSLILLPSEDVIFSLFMIDDSAHFGLSSMVFLDTSLLSTVGLTGNNITSALVITRVWHFINV